jgi:hypothetical protein
MPGRGEARTLGKIVSGDIMPKADGWLLSLVIACEPGSVAASKPAWIGVSRRSPLSPMRPMSTPPSTKADATADAALVGLDRGEFVTAALVAIPGKPLRRSFAKVRQALQKNPSLDEPSARYRAN